MGTDARIQSERRSVKRERQEELQGGRNEKSSPNSFSSEGVWEKPLDTQTTLALEGGYVPSPPGSERPLNASPGGPSFTFLFDG